MVDNLGAEILGDFLGIGLRLNLHGLNINLSTHVEDQKRDQHYGLEHLGMIAHDIDSAVENLPQVVPRCWRKSSPRAVVGFISSKDPMAFSSS